MADAPSSAIPPEACHACLDLDLEQNARPDNEDSQLAWYRTEAISLQELKRLAQGGCRGCKVLLFAVNSYIERWHGHNIEISTVEQPPSRFFVQLCVDDREDHYFELNKLPGQDDAEQRWPHSLPVKSPISGYTGSDEAISTARSWLATCLSQHSTTCPTNLLSRLPTRVLRIDGPEQVSLHISQGEDEPYACLSHCWGDKPLSLLRTTAATLVEFQSGIPWDSLPNTFRDAIHFTHQLGLRFLWVDSLCIVQDSADDWRHEGSMMANIYEAALFTLAATKAPNADSGLFAYSKPKHLSRVTTLESLGIYTEDAVHAIHAREGMAHELRSGPSLPLLSRGWALQERLLSRRTILFTEDEIGFECDTYHRCECSSESSLLDNVQGLGRFRNQHHFDVLTHQDIWQRVVSAYTRKLLTFSTDIFPALQGLAQRFETGMGEYYAGHWEKTLEYSLTWYSGRHFSEPHRPRPQTPENWRAPSWSWASVDDEVSFPNLSGCSPRSFVTVVDVMTVPIGDSLMGQISVGALVLAGKCLLATLEVCWEGQGNLKHYCIRTLPRTASNADHLCLREDTFKRNFDPGSSYYIRNEVLFDYDFSIAGPYHVARGSEVLLMKVDERLDREHRRRSWLIFREIDAEKHICERIGVIKLPWEDEKTREMDRLYEEEAAEMEITVV